MISICIPVYQMDNWKYFLQRNLFSISAQTYTNYEIVVSDDSEGNDIKNFLKPIKLPIRYFKNQESHGMANNVNHTLDRATGDLIKILFQDDYFYHTGALDEINTRFTPSCQWLVTACTHTLDGVHTFNDHKPFYSESENNIGSPSVITLRKGITVRFDPNFKWVLDLDFYKQLFRHHGKPKIFDKVNVVIGLHPGQETNKLPDSTKAHEHQMLKIKYESEDVTR